MIFFYADLEITIENLRQFVRQHSSVYMVLKGCLQQFDDVAGKLVAAIAKSGAESPDINVILNEAENLNELLDDDKVSTNHITYVCIDKAQTVIPFSENHKLNMKTIV